jgi:hypothetical protein
MSEWIRNHALEFAMGWARSDRMPGPRCRFVVMENNRCVENHDD